MQTFSAPQHHTCSYILSHDLGLHSKWIVLIISAIFLHLMHRLSKCTFPFRRKNPLQHIEDVGKQLAQQQTGTFTQQAVKNRIQARSYIWPDIEVGKLFGNIWSIDKVTQKWSRRRCHRWQGRCRYCRSTALVRKGRVRVKQLAFPNAKANGWPLTHRGGILLLIWDHMCTLHETTISVDFEQTR